MPGPLPGRGPAVEKHCSKPPDQLCGLPSLLFSVYPEEGGGAFPGGYAARACNLLLTSSSAEIRNECKLYVLHDNNITFAVVGMT